MVHVIEEYPGAVRQDGISLQVARIKMARRLEVGAARDSIGTVLG